MFALSVHLAGVAGIALIILAGPSQPDSKEGIIMRIVKSWHGIIAQAASFVRSA